jgi:hypothetical protein
MIPLAEAAHKPIEERQTVIDEDIALPFDLPEVARKKVSAAFDGGRITSDGGVMLLAQAERRLGVAERLDERTRRLSVFIGQCTPHSIAANPIKDRAALGA